MNLACGVLGVIAAMGGDLPCAFLLMLLASVFDFCDGLAARALDVVSETGKQLDSLSDLVSFGVLPSLMLYQTAKASGAGWTAFIPIAIALASAVRLAKFNLDDRQKTGFLGLATPASAMICGSFAHYVALNPTGLLAGWAASAAFIPVAALVLSALLVSEIPMFSLKFTKNTPKSLTIKRLILVAVALASVLAAFLLHKSWSLAVLLTFTGYVLINCIAAPFCKKEAA